MCPTNKRRAVAMIELIFSIVVMGLAMLAIPMITSQTMKGSQSALMQESISEAAANISMILSLPWDNAYNAATPASEAEILAADSANFKTRAGLRAGENARVFPPPPYRKATSNTADTNYDDISDYNGRTTKVALYSNQTNEIFSGDYADTAVEITSSVVYYPDATTGAMGETTVFNFNPTGNNGGGSTNIKKISTTLTTTTSGLSKNITLNAFSCNIGSATAKTRIWP